MCVYVCMSVTQFKLNNNSRSFDRNNNINNINNPASRARLTLGNGINKRMKNKRNKQAAAGVRVLHPSLQHAQNGSCRYKTYFMPTGGAITPPTTTTAIEGVTRHKLWCSRLAQHPQSMCLLMWNQAFSIRGKNASAEKFGVFACGLLALLCPLRGGCSLFATTARGKVWIC